MAIQQHIRNPIEWGWDSLKQTGRALNSAGHTIEGAWEGNDRSVPRVRRIGWADLKEVLRQGFEDFGAYRTDVIFLCLLYPIVGLILSRLIWGYGTVPLLFPLASGFALIAPFFAVGLYEMSRRREAGARRGLGRRLRRGEIAGAGLDHGAGPPAAGAVRAVAGRRAHHLAGDARTRAAASRWRPSPTMC